MIIYIYLYTRISILDSDSYILQTSVPRITYIYIYMCTGVVLPKCHPEVAFHPRSIISGVWSSRSALAFPYWPFRPAVQFSRSSLAFPYWPFRPAVQFSFNPPDCTPWWFPNCHHLSNYLSYPNQTSFYRSTGRKSGVSFDTRTEARLVIQSSGRILTFHSGWLSWSTDLTRLHTNLLTPSWLFPLRYPSLDILTSI